MIYHITPYLTGDIGKGINDTIRCLPDDAWVCLRDIDTMFLLPQQPSWLEEIVASTKYDVLGARCNRLGDKHQLWGEDISDIDSIQHHIDIAKLAFIACDKDVAAVSEQDNLAGFFLLFKKSVWETVPFAEKTIQFDLQWNKDLKDKGFKRGLMRGIYLWHTYRLGSDKPQQSINHLINCHDYSLTKPKEYFQ